MNLDWKCINNIRALSIDMVQAANSGHPGAPLGLAPVAHVLFQNFNYSCTWINRDRFVLSNGHACALQYSIMYLFGFLQLDDLRNFRQLGSPTAGHPESHVPGIEVTTGPLGQGIANGVGLAIAQVQMAATFNKPDFPLFTNHTVVICGDGCLQEGVSTEACSLAGHLKLPLIIIYDDNSISIDGETGISFTEDVSKRFESYGFKVISVLNGDEDLPAIENAIKSAKQHNGPSLVRVRTTIGYGAKLQGTASVHGAPLGPKEVENVKRFLDLEPEKSFYVLPEVMDHYDSLKSRIRHNETEWQELFRSYCSKYPQLGHEIERRFLNKLPENWHLNLPRYSENDPEIATRKLSQMVLNRICDTLPEIIGGSADLTGSNLTRWDTAVDFQADSNIGALHGRYIRYGVREHGMMAINNGIYAYGGFIPMSSTFLNFITYGWGAFRLSALSKVHSLFIMTHDSIGLGEDGPTHQPIEVLSALRATPGVLVLRPADGNEVSAAYKLAIEEKKPAVLCLSRQNLPQLNSSIENALKGGYVVYDCENPRATLVSTGSEVSICVEAAKKIQARVVSLMCWEVFDSQSLEYRNEVFADFIVPVISVEAGSTLGWKKYADYCIGIDSFGASGPYKKVYDLFGLNPNAICASVNQFLSTRKSRLQ